jgi:hypothetical protein
MYFERVTVWPEGLNVEQAVVGFVGVFVGAVITAGANYVLAVRKEKAEGAKDRLSCQ